MRSIFHKSFTKQYKKIPIKIRRQFDERFVLFVRDPFNVLLHNHALSGDREGQWSINVTGDWRAIYEFKDADTIIFVEIDTHANLYQ